VKSSSAACQVLQIVGLGEERQLSEASTLMFRDWQANLNSIFGEGDFRPRPQMDDWFCISQEPIAGRRKTRTNFADQKAGQRNIAEDTHSISTDDANVSPVPLRLEDSQYGRLRRRSRLKMNSRLLGLDRGPRRPDRSSDQAKGNCEGACATNRTAPTSGEGEPPFPLDKDLSWMPNIRNQNE
jgi:hypothetical protein